MSTNFGLEFYDGLLSELVDKLKEDILKKNKVRIYTPNVDHIINIKNNKDIYGEYRKAEYIVADGWPVVLTSKIKNTPLHKITGVDLMDELLKVSDNSKLNIFFLGATDETLIKMKNNIKSDFNNINSIEYHDGYFNDDELVINKINSTNSNILFVGMGSPKQELWITENIDKLNVNIAIAVGGAFKIYSNEVSRAPKFIRKIGMEWFYRFLKEPTRLFSRYFIKYPKFLKYFIKEMKG